MTLTSLAAASGVHSLPVPYRPNPYPYHITLTSLLQPLVSMALSALVVASVGAGTELSMPGLNALGSVPIGLGLVIILAEGRRQHERDAKQSLLISVQSEEPPLQDAEPQYEASQPVVPSTAVSRPPTGIRSTYNRTSPCIEVE